MVKGNRRAGKTKEAVSPGNGALQKSFKKGSKNSPRSKVEEEKEKDKDQRVQNASFLSYLRCALKNKSSEVRGEAESVHAHYFSLSPTEKRTMITDFFRVGGKRPGLSCLYQHTLVVKQKMKDGHWSGYCTAGMLCDLHKVLGLMRPRNLPPKGSRRKDTSFDKVQFSTTCISQNKHGHHFLGPKGIIAPI